jgi:hypothetical protein
MQVLPLIFVLTLEGRLSLNVSLIIGKICPAISPIQPQNLARLSLIQGRGKASTKASHLWINILINCKTIELAINVYIIESLAL